MAQKSPKVVKMKPEEKQQEPTLDEKWEVYHNVELETVKMMLVKAKRIDTYHDLRAEFHDWYGDNPTHAQTLNDQTLMVELCEWMVKLVEGWKLEDFLVEEYDDPYLAYLDKMPGNTLDDAYHRWLAWQLIRPFGERAVNLWHYIQEEQNKDADAAD